jgi:hypothetical protein
LGRLLSCLGICFTSSAEWCNQRRKGKGITCTTKKNCDQPIINLL